MKVVCIDERWQYDVEDAKWIKPVFGDVCQVISTEQDSDGSWYYTLVGYTGYFETKAFAPISSIDETEFQRNYKRETIK